MCFICGEEELGLQTYILLSFKRVHCPKTRQRVCNSNRQSAKNMTTKNSKQRTKIRTSRRMHRYLTKLSGWMKCLKYEYFLAGQTQRKMSIFTASLCKRLSQISFQPLCKSCLGGSNSCPYIVPSELLPLSQKLHKFGLFFKLLPS